MQTPPAFHAFTFEGNTFTGIVTKFEFVEGTIQFAYSYVCDYVIHEGSFTGEEKNGAFIGAWKDTSRTPLKGKSAWSGSARLRLAQDGGRTVLYGVWAMPGVSDERWVIDVISFSGPK